MNDFLSNKLSKATEQLTHDLEHFLLFKFPPFHELLQISIFTKLRDDVKTVFRTEDILELDDVVMIKTL